mgnify:CR=1 FL=1
MQIDIILEPDLTTAQVAEIAVAAENYGFRTLWHSNYHQNPDAFVALVPAFVLGRTLGTDAGLQLGFFGTSILIAVGVALETMKQIESQLLMRHYEGFLG